MGESQQTPLTTPEGIPYGKVQRFQRRPGRTYTPKPVLPVNIDWENVDWSKPNSVLARELGVTQGVVWDNRILVYKNKLSREAGKPALPYHNTNRRRPYGLPPFPRKTVAESIVWSMLDF